MLCTARNSLSLRCIMQNLTERAKRIAEKILRSPFKTPVIKENFCENDSLEEQMAFYSARTYLKRKGLISRNRNCYINALPKRKKRTKADKICKRSKYKRYPYSEKVKKKWIQRCRIEFDEAIGVDAKLNALYRNAKFGKFNTGENYKILRTAWIPAVSGNCEVCKKNIAYCKHHIVPLSRGGNNSDTNLINICLDCHKKIHPFME